MIRAIPALSGPCLDALPALHGASTKEQSGKIARFGACLICALIYRRLINSEQHRYTSTATKYSKQTKNLKMPRNNRHRAVTLTPGSPFHDAFFGQDDSIRMEFDQEKAVQEFCTPRRLRTRNQRQNSGKSGRPVFPRYGSF